MLSNSGFIDMVANMAWFIKAEENVCICVRSLKNRRYKQCRITLAVWSNPGRLLDIFNPFLQRVIIDGV